MFINNRRYIGSKVKILNNIQSVVDSYFKKDQYKFTDLFAGTGVVGERFASFDKEVIINDFLYSNYLAYVTWLSKESVNLDNLTYILNDFNNLKPETLDSNYFSNIYGNKYFSNNDAKIIGYIREELEKLKYTLNFREFALLVTSLIYTVDKIAHTVGHFEHYLSKSLCDKGVKIVLPELKEYKKDITIYNEDANQLIKKIKSDIIYIDPPYNARQYINFYHVLENLARWEKPTEFEGISMKFKRNHLKSDYSKSKAKNVFNDLITDCDCKLIIVSYNNTYNANSGASNNKILESDLMNILAKKGKTNFVDIPYKHFNAGKTNFINHIEKLFICEVL
jgi:adenine-specific DNA-methyltransferase